MMRSLQRLHNRISEHPLFPLLCAVIIALVFYACGIRICPFYNVFHMPCPGCGCTRAFAALLRGDISRSWEYNPAVLCILSFSLITYPFRSTLKEYAQRHPLAVGIIVIMIAAALWMRNLNHPMF